MDRISELHDELLLKILSLLPNTKDAAATLVLSKRWKPLWTMLPRLVYDDNNYLDNVEYARFSRFVDRTLLLHKAPTLETLHFNIADARGAQDIPFWTRAAENRNVRELIIEIDTSSVASPPVLPRSLYTEHRTLVTLELCNVILVDVSSPVSFPSLKTLVLESVKYPGGDEFVERFLSSCQVLEQLVVEQCPGDNVTVFTIRVASLKTLLIKKSEDRDMNEADGFVIRAPSLKWLGICDIRGGSCVIEEGMPLLKRAIIDVGYSSAGNILASISSVKRLCLCLQYSKNVCPVDTVFNRLKHLSLCTCEPGWLNMLMCLLKGSPKLESLKIDQCNPSPPSVPWNEPSSIPTCLLSSFETLEWEKYEGTEEEKKLAEFIIRNGSCLKKVSVSSKSTDHDKKLEMIQEFSVLPKRSPTCHLIFN